MHKRKKEGDKETGVDLGEKDREKMGKF